MYENNIFFIKLSRSPTNTHTQTRTHTAGGHTQRGFDSDVKLFAIE